MSIVGEIWESFCRLPFWVRLWIFLWLVPMNGFSLAFLDEPNGTVVAALALGGMIPNLLILVFERGFSRLLSLPHLLIWQPCIAIGAVTVTQPSVSPTFVVYLWVLIATNTISIAFDYFDFFRWLRGERAIA